jgi:hypothetical protein
MKNQGNHPRGAYKKGATMLGNAHKQNAKITENFPNQNMYGESDYKMKKDMRFDQDGDEQNFKRNIFFRYIDSINIICLLINLKNIFFLIVEWHRNCLLQNLMRILNLSVTIFSLLIIKNIDKFVNNSIYIRWFFEIDNILSTIMILTRNYKVEFFIPIKYLLIFLYNLVFNLNLAESSVYYIIKTLIIFALLQNSADESLFSRFLHNSFSFNGVYLIIMALFFILCQCALTLGNKQLWALYDSFKKSYFTLKNISDDLPFPIFVVNLKRQTGQIVNQNANPNPNYLFTVLYKNSEAEKLNTKVKKIRDKMTKYSNPNTRLQKTDVNFKDLFEKSVEKLLDAEIEKCISNNIKHFDFPLIIGDNKLTWRQHPNFPTLFEGDLENIKWVRIILNPTTWKGQECLMIQIMENYDIQHSNFIDEYRGLLADEFLKVIENIDIICDKAPDRNKEKLELSKSPLLNYCSRSNNNGTITPDMLRSPNPLHPHFLKSPVILPNKLYASPQNVIQEHNDNKSSVHLSIIKPSNPINNLNQIKRNYENILKFAANSNIKENIVKSLDNKTNSTANSLVPQSNVIKTQFDYSLLFLLKNSINYIYDMYLTVNILNSLSVNIIHTKLTQFHFENLIRYFISYFSPLLKIKNLRIDLFSEIDGEINAIYDYYRVIFFNVILFIINNIETKTTEQVLQINVMHVRFSDEGSSFYEVTFNLHDENPKIPYPLVDQILSTFMTTELRNTCIEKYKIIDIGLVVSSMIVNIVYNSELKFTSVGSNQHKITFLIHNHGGNSENISFHKNFTRKKFEVEEKYYNKITERVFKKSYTPVKEHHETNVKSFVKKNTAVRNVEEDDKCKYLLGV